MDAVLALVGLVVFIASVIVFAAAVTWTVVRVTPTRSSEKRSQAS